MVSWNRINMTNTTCFFSSLRSRLGFHYFPDTFHYRESDLQTYLPEWMSLGMNWLTLQAPTDRAVPEYFINGLVNNRIEPILQFNFSLAQPPAVEEIQLMLESYSRWGVRLVQFFDRPNARSSWSSSTWAQQNLVDRFLDRYLPFANLALDKGLIPVMPPLQPGGSYWDTAFLRSTLESLERRKQNRVLQSLVLSAYAWTNNHPLDWGAGGPDAWPNAHPYMEDPSVQDQRGFHIYDWYESITQAVLQKSVPTILYGLGAPSDPAQSGLPLSIGEHTDLNLTLARMLSGDITNTDNKNAQSLSPVPSNVLCGCFWLQSAAEKSAFINQAWFRPDGSQMPIVDRLRSWLISHNEEKPAAAHSIPTKKDPFHPISHYLLLPVQEWGVADWKIDAIRPFMKRSRPTVGFSFEEAALATRVTVFGGENVFPEEKLNDLRRAGCYVERVGGDGIKIASILTER